MNSRKFLTFFLLLFTIIACNSFHKKGQSLIKVNLIKEKLQNKLPCQLIDLRREEEFAAGHIPSARQLWRSDLEDKNNKLDGMRISKEGLEKALGKAGIHAFDSIFIYDAKGNVDAARLWWLLQYYGYEKVALIDGGYIQWRMYGFTIEEGLPVHSPTNFFLPETGKAEILAEKNAIKHEGYQQIIDARTREEYTGEILKNGALRGGHIPGAIHFDYFEMIDGGAFTIKSVEQLLQEMHSRGLDTDKKTINYCHSGVRSAFVTFVMQEVLGMDDVSNYDGSWIEWSADDNCQVETGENAIVL